MQIKKFIPILGFIFVVAGCSGVSKTPGSVKFSPPDHKAASDINVRMGQEYFKLGQYLRAKSKLLHAVKLQPRSSYAHSALATFYENIDELQLSEHHHLLSVKFSDEGFYHNNYGAFLCKRHKYKDAEVEFLAALQDSDLVNTAAVYENVGCCMLEAKNNIKAINYLTKAYKHNPNKISVKLHLARAKYNIHKYKEALNFIEQYHNYAKFSSSSLLLSINIKDKLGNPVDDDALKLRNLFPHSAELKNYNSKLVNNSNNTAANPDTFNG